MFQRKWVRTLKQNKCRIQLLKSITIIIMEIDWTQHQRKHSFGSPLNRDIKLSEWTPLLNTYWALRIHMSIKSEINILLCKDPFSSLECVAGHERNWKERLSQVCHLLLDDLWQVNVSEYWFNCFNRGQNNSGLVKIYYFISFLFRSPSFQAASWSSEDMGFVCHKVWSYLHYGSWLNTTFRFLPARNGKIQTSGKHSFKRHHLQVTLILINSNTLHCLFELLGHI